MALTKIEVEGVVKNLTPSQSDALRLVVGKGGKVPTNVVDGRIRAGLDRKGLVKLVGKGGQDLSLTPDGRKVAKRLIA